MQNPGEAGRGKADAALLMTMPASSAAKVRPKVRSMPLAAPLPPPARPILQPFRPPPRIKNTERGIGPLYPGVFAGLEPNHPAVSVLNKGYSGWIF